MAKKYQRWSLRIGLGLVNEPGNVSAFFNMGSNPSGGKIGRQSVYWKAWTLANGEPPRKGEEMTPDRFFEGQSFRVVVDYVNKGDDGELKPEAELYLRITKFVSVERP
jgi:hypothetical protein